MIAHRLTGASLLFTGEIAAGLAHFDQAIGLYNPAEHRSLTTQFGQDTRVTSLSWRALALWMLGYPEAALVAVDGALKNARKIGQAATLMFALTNTLFTHICCGNHVAASAQAEKVIDLADQKGASVWKALGMMHHGRVHSSKFCELGAKKGNAFEIDRVLRPLARRRYLVVTKNGSGTLIRYES